MGLEHVQVGLSSAGEASNYASPSDPAKSHEGFPKRENLSQAQASSSSGGGAGSGSAANANKGKSRLVESENNHHNHHNAPASFVGSGNSESWEKMKTMTGLFPRVSREELRNALAVLGGDVDATIAMLMEDWEDGQEPVGQTCSFRV